MNRFALRARCGSFELDAHARWEAPCAALFGASGSGKSTILEGLAGLRRDVRGEVVLAGERLDPLPVRARRVGWVPQDAALFPHLSAGANVRYAVRPRGDAALAARAIDALEIGALLDRRAPELSGGERQRVAIARALASNPRFLLLDEPLASVDRPLRARIVPFLERIHRDLGVPLLLVTHDPLEVTALARHAFVLERGRIVAEGDPRALFPSAVSFGGLAALGAENLYAVTLTGRAPGLLRLRTAAGLELEMAELLGFPAPDRVAIRAEDVLVATSRPDGLSAQNVIPGCVVRIEPIPPHVLVHADAGGEVVQARLTARAVETLALEAGRPIHLVVKAHAVHPA